MSTVSLLIMKLDLQTHPSLPNLSLQNQSKVSPDHKILFTCFIVSLSVIVFIFTSFFILSVFFSLSVSFGFERLKLIL